MSVAFGAHYVHSLRRQAVAQGLSHALLFFDLESAFYSVQRSCIVDNLLQHDLRGSDDEVLLAALPREAALAELKVPASLRAWVQTVFASNWTQVRTNLLSEASDQALMPTRGSRPGGPTADLTFTALLQTVLCRFIAAARHLLPVDHTGHLLQPVVWMDDIALFLQHPSPSVLVQQVGQAAVLMHEQCHAVGLTLNFRRGKTEGLLRLQGRGVQNVHAQLAQTPGELPLAPFGLDQQLSLTSSYTHLGQRHNSSMCWDTELSVRVAHAQEALVACMPLFRKHSLSPATRLTLLQALVFSKLFFAAETWHGVAPAALARVSAFVVKAYRRVLGRVNLRSNEHSTDAALFAEWPLVDADTFLRVARLRRLFKVCVDGPPELLRVLRAEGLVRDDTWFQFVAHDLVWMQQHAESLHHLPSPFVDFDAWTQFVRECGPSWKKWCGRIAKQHAVHSQIQAAQQLWEQDIEQLFVHAGFPVPSPLPPVEDEVSFACDLCDFTCASARALSVHKHQLHQVKAEVRRFMPYPTMCLMCRRDFYTLQKHRQHLQYRANGCLDRLEEIFHPEPPEEFRSVATNKMQRDEYRKPAVRICGPLLPCKDDWLRAAPGKVFPVPHAAPVSPAALLLDALVDWHSATSRHSATWPTIPSVHGLSRRQTSDVWESFLSHVELYELDDEEVLTYDQVHMLFRQQCGVSGAVPAPAPAVPEVPKPLMDPCFDGSYFVLYCYAGHQRGGDVHDACSALGGLYGFAVKVVPLDVIYHSTLCNLLLPTTQLFWRRIVASGVLLGVVGAPPCETWSVARWRSFWQLDDGPPPVRTSSEPWGKISNGLKHQHQVLTANRLMHVWLVLAVLSVAVQTAFMMEHPACPSVHCAASIWLVKQGQQTPTSKPWISLFGKLPSGAWATQQAKAYPANLNLAIMESFFMRAASLRSTGDRPCCSQLPTGFFGAVQCIRDAMAFSGREMGLDYAS
eukprot:Skav210470  [mRNA]  locus=scaffold737:307907:310931:- [translate_table: standard]